MHAHQVVVGGEPHVALDAVGAVVERPAVGGEGVLGLLVTGMDLSYDRGRLAEVTEQVEARQGVIAVRVWVNEGRLTIGDDIMYALVAGDIREKCSAACRSLCA